MNKKGAAMILALVLSISVLPTAVALLAIARSDLNSALDDYHWARAWRGAWGGVSMVERDLRAGGAGEAAWPDPELDLIVQVSKVGNDWQVEATACSGRAVVKAVRLVSAGE